MDISKKFPFYYQEEYSKNFASYHSILSNYIGGLTSGEDTTAAPPPLSIEDLTLAEYSICNKIFFDLNSYVLGIDTHIKNQNPSIKEIEIERTVYAPTDHPDVPNLFEHLLVFLQEHADNFSLELGEGFAVSPTFIENMRNKYESESYLQTNPIFERIMDIENPPDLTKKVTLPRDFALLMRQSLLQGLVEKLAYNFQGSEFVIGFNLAVLEYNTEVEGIKKRIININEMAEYLYENCPHCVDEVEKKIHFVQFKLTQHKRFNLDGSINYDEWVFKDFDNIQKQRIKKVKRLANIFLNNAVAEIKDKLGLDKLPLSLIAFPNTTVTRLEGFEDE